MTRGTSNFEALSAHILPLSRSKVFDVARREWDLIGVSVSEDWGECPCTQAIKEHCYIRNRITGHETHVGNVCINRFIGIDTGQLFPGLRRIFQNEVARPNHDLIEHAHRLGYLYGKSEYEFLMGIRHKRILSPKQEAWLKKINRRIRSQISVKKVT